VRQENLNWLRIGKRVHVYPAASHAVWNEWSRDLLWSNIFRRR